MSAAEVGRRSVVTVGMFKQSFAHADGDLPLVFVTTSNRVLACRGLVLEGERRVRLDLHEPGGEGGVDGTATAGRLLSELRPLPDSREVVLPGGMQLEAVFPVVAVSVRDTPLPCRQTGCQSRQGGES